MKLLSISSLVTFLPGVVVACIQSHHFWCCFVWVVLVVEMGWEACLGDGVKLRWTGNCMDGMISIGSLPAGAMNRKAMGIPMEAFFSQGIVLTCDASLSAKVVAIFGLLSHVGPLFEASLYAREDLHVLYQARSSSQHQHTIQIKNNKTASILLSRL
ncbi:hypothetical protein J3F83DRAFT_727505 [Trichoderma novae-zelandiae]